MKTILTLSFLLMAAIAGTAKPGHYTIRKTFHIKSGGGWDYIAVSPVGNELYVSHGTQVNILDKRNGDSLGIIPGTKGVHGIAFDAELNHGYTSNGRLNNVFVFDLKTYQVLDSIPTGQNPDAIFYEPFSKKIITCNGRSNDASVIDPLTNKVVATIPLGGAPETPVSDGRGNMYIAIEDKNEVVQVAMVQNAWQVIKRYKLGGGEEPAGLAIGTDGAFLYAGCGNSKLVVLAPHAAEGHNLLKVLPIGEHCDGVVIDNANHQVFAACGDGTVHVINTDSKKAPFTVAEIVHTKRGARTIAIDEKSHLLYLPTAAFEPQAAGTHERPKMIPGTFEVLVVGQ